MFSESLELNCEVKVTPVQYQSTFIYTQYTFVRPQGHTLWASCMNIFNILAKNSLTFFSFFCYECSKSESFS